MWPDNETERDFLNFTGVADTRGLSRFAANGCSCRGTPARVQGAAPSGENDDEAKREFLRDVTSFANSVGGDLIYRVREARDAGGTPAGILEAVVGLPGGDLDQEESGHYADVGRSTSR